MNALKSFLLLFNWRYLLMLHRYSREWDKELNERMSQNTFKLSSDHTAKIGDKEVWIANHPYGSFTEWRGMTEDKDDRWKVRPSRATIQRAHKKLLEDCSEPFSEDHDDFEVRSKIITALVKDLEEMKEILDDSDVDNADSDHQEKTDER